MEVSHVLVGGFTYPDQGAFTLDLKSIGMFGPTYHHPSALYNPLVPIKEHLPLVCCLLVCFGQLITLVRNLITLI